MVLTLVDGSFGRISRPLAPVAPDGYEPSYWKDLLRPAGLEKGVGVFEPCAPMGNGCDLRISSNAYRQELSERPACTHHNQRLESGIGPAMFGDVVC